jgi:hypothetical protein
MERVLLEGRNTAIVLQERVIIVFQAAGRARMTKNAVRKCANNTILSNGVRDTEDRV